MTREAILGVWPVLGGWSVRTTAKVRQVPTRMMNDWVRRVQLEPARMAHADCCLLVDEAGAITSIERPDKDEAPS